MSNDPVPPPVQVREKVVSSNFEDLEREVSQLRRLALFSLGIAGSSLVAVALLIVMIYRKPTAEADLSQGSIQQYVIGEDNNAIDALSQRVKALELVRGPRVVREQDSRVTYDSKGRMVIRSGLVIRNAAGQPALVLEVVNGGGGVFVYDSGGNKLIDVYAVKEGVGVIAIRRNRERYVTIAGIADAGGNIATHGRDGEILSVLCSENLL